MIPARFEFDPKHAESFIENGHKGQTVIEMMFESVEALIEASEQFRPYLVNCTAFINDKTIDLRAVSGLH